MGSRVAAAGEHRLKLDIVAPGPIDSVDLVRSGEVVEQIPGDGARELSLERTLLDGQPGETLYVRVVQAGQGAAWSSPYFFEQR
jgi:hypothetical protein